MTVGKDVSMLFPDVCNCMQVLVNMKGIFIVLEESL